MSAGYTIPGAIIHDRKLLVGNSVITALLHLGKVHTEYPLALSAFSRGDSVVSGRLHPITERNSPSGTYRETLLFSTNYSKMSY